MDIFHAQHYLDGEWLDSPTGSVVTIPDPGTGEPAGTASFGTPTDAQTALAAATAAFRSWSRTLPHERAQLLHRAATLLRARTSALATLLTREGGKPYPDNVKEITFAADVVDYYAEEGERVSGEWTPTRSASTRSLVLKQPVGVVAAILPWNYPIDLFAWKVGPALAAGCTVVAKPAEETPLATAAAVACFADAGLPAGVLNLVLGTGEEVGEALVRNPLTRKITFTGSTSVGQRIMAAAAPNLTRLTLELGGQCPFIVCADADLARAVPAALRRSFSNMGQICIAVNRIYVEQPVAEEFATRLAEATRALRVGYGLDPGVDYGPMINAATRHRVEEHVADAVAHGATVLAGGREPDGAAYARGYYYLPTVLSDIRADMRVMYEETFGPVAPVMAVGDLDEALRQANGTPFGLAAYVYTESLDRAFYAAEELEAGGVGVNVNDVTELAAPFGGWKKSGFGRELGHAGLDACLETKHVRIGLGPR